MYLSQIFFFAEAFGHTVKMFWTESEKMSNSPCAVALGQKHINGHVWYATPVWVMTGAELDFSVQKQVCDVKIALHVIQSVFVF